MPPKFDPDKYKHVEANLKRLGKQEELDALREYKEYWPDRYKRFEERDKNIRTPGKGPLEAWGYKTYQPSGQRGGGGTFHNAGGQGSSKGNGSGDGGNGGK